MRAATRREVVALLRRDALERRELPFVLACGALSRDYVDVKHAVATGRALALVVDALLALADDLELEFDAVGGLTLGADALAHAAALLDGRAWFTVRKEPKGHGRASWLEGARLGGGSTALLVDDVVTTGNSLLRAYRRVRETGATVVGALAVLDRGDVAASRLDELGVPYAALTTYLDLDLEPVGPSAEVNRG